MKERSTGYIRISKHCNHHACVPMCTVVCMCTRVPMHGPAYSQLVQGVAVRTVTSSMFSAARKVIATATQLVLISDHWGGIWIGM